MCIYIYIYIYIYIHIHTHTHTHTGYCYSVRILKVLYTLYEHFFGQQEIENKILKYNADNL